MGLNLRRISFRLPNHPSSMNAVSNNQSRVQNNSRTPALVEICVVCGDQATGNHYGAVSCDGCKTFFRRSVQNKPKFTCRSRRKCVVTKNRRDQCKYCKLRKCMKAGMTAEAVQNEQIPTTPRRQTEDRGTNTQPRPWYIITTVKVYV